MPGRRLRWRLEAAADPGARRTTLDGASYTAMAQLAQQPELFDLPLDVVEYCLLEFPSSFLANPECPPGLEQRIRAPHDVASLELTIRAGLAYYSRRRVASMLKRLGVETLPAHARFVATIPAMFVRALRQCHLLRVDTLLDELAAVDLRDAAICAEVLPNLGYRLPSFVDELVEALTREPGCHRLAPSSSGCHDANSPTNRCDGSSLPDRQMCSQWRNARYMCNCTAGYRSSIEAGERFILIVDDVRDPDVRATQKRLNVEIIADGKALRVGEINDIDNFSGGPGWVRQALNRWFAQWRANVDNRAGEPPVRARADRRRRNGC
jgi:hypothetical protein